MNENARYRLRQEQGRGDDPFSFLWINPSCAFPPERGDCWQLSSSWYTQSKHRFCSVPLSTRRQLFWRQVIHLAWCSLCSLAILVLILLFLRRVISLHARKPYHGNMILINGKIKVKSCFIEVKLSKLDRQTCTFPQNYLTSTRPKWTSEVITFVSSWLIIDIFFKITEMEYHQKRCN